MKKAVIIVGGFRETIELVEKIQLEIIGIVDVSNKEVGYTRYPYLGTDEEFLGNQGNSKVEVVISPDLPKIRRMISDRYEAAGYSLAVINAGSVSDSATLSEGVLIQELAYVSANVKLGKGVKLNVGAKVMHDSTIGDFTTIAPSAVVLGYVKIGKDCYIGSNATILPKVTIADGVIVGAGAVVTKDVLARSVVKGVPAE